MSAERLADLQQAQADLADMVASPDGLDVRIVAAIAGDRELNAREQSIIDRLKSDRGESLFSDMLYILTHKTFPSRQAKTLWLEIAGHRASLEQKLGRDPGIVVSAHDYLTNISGLLKTVGLIEETKLTNLRDVARRDGLTGLFDKATFLRQLKEELERRQRYEMHMTLVMLDIDHFKKLNDTHGHADGDIVLTQVADIIQNQARTTDIAARYGGEEFSVILPGVSAKEGTIFAERTRAAVEAAFQHSGYMVTISAGVAQALGEDTADSLIRRTDAKLYTAKHQGRNQVCTA